MTGFGVGDVAVADGRVVVEVRSVNQRFLDVRARLPREIAELTLFAEQIAREKLRRGRVEIVVHTEGAVFQKPMLDHDKAKMAFRALSDLRDELAPGSELPLSLLAAVPDLFTPPAGRELEQLRDGMKSAVEQALSEMDAMCKREGSALAGDLRGRCAVLRSIVTEIVAAAERGKEPARKRMRERLERALGGLDSPSAPLIDPLRIEAEILLVTERTDVTEELTRLASHLDQFEAALGVCEPVGRKLEFLLQEMLRETNTLGSKAQDAGVGQHVVEMKVELERLREQVQNIE